ncbi:MAG: ROK family protein [Ginsengibacter sp.]
MALLAFDLGGTKLAMAVFNEEGDILFREVSPVQDRGGADVGRLITGRISSLLEDTRDNIHEIQSIGISVPGIYYAGSGKVWAPNIAGWEEYPLLAEVKKAAGEIPVTIDSDRACYILGEQWKGKAQECIDAIFLAVGTGIGAGIMVDGNVLRGSHDIAGAIGWMALQHPFDKKFTRCGCFEYFASGEGIADMAKRMLEEQKGDYRKFKDKSVEDISSHDVFAAYDTGDKVAVKVIGICIEFWGMACANLISLFNPEKIIFGGGVFGPAVSLIPRIKEEAAKWAQPVSMQQVSFESSGLGSDAGLYGAGFLALKKLHP